MNRRPDINKLLQDQDPPIYLTYYVEVRQHLRMETTIEERTAAFNSLSDMKKIESDRWFVCWKMENGKRE